MKIAKHILKNHVYFDSRFSTCWYCHGDHYFSNKQTRITGVKKGYYPRCYFKQYFL